MTFCCAFVCVFFFFFQAEDGIRDIGVTGVQTCALPIFERLERSSPPAQDCIGQSQLPLNMCGLAFEPRRAMRREPFELYARLIDTPMCVHEGGRNIQSHEHARHSSPVRMLRGAERCTCVE